MPRLELFLFRSRDPRTGKWVRALYCAERHEIAARSVDREIIGPAESRDVETEARYYTPHATLIDVQPDLQPTLDALEALSVLHLERLRPPAVLQRPRLAPLAAAGRGRDG